MLMDPDNRRIKHLDIRFADIRYSIQDAIPDACLSPSIEAVVAGRVGAKASRQIPPRRTGAQDPEDAVQDAPVATCDDCPCRREISVERCNGHVEPPGNVLCRDVRLFQ